MARRALRRTTLPSTSTVAMLDVIFILFAFFLAVSQIRKSTVPVQLPEISDSAATGDREDATPPLRYVIQVAVDGRLGVDGRMFHTREAFFEHFRRRLAADGAAERGVVAEIVTDRAAEMGVGVDLVNFLAKEGVKRLEFLAVERGPEGGR